MINGVIGYYFPNRERLEESNHVSSVILDICCDVMDFLIARVKENGQVGGIIPPLLESVVSIT